MTENKCKRGKLYKLISNQTEDVYYGSTIENKLTNRLAGHRNSYRGWLEGKKPYMTSFEIVKYDDAKKCYREENKDIIRERKMKTMTCGCGSEFRQNDKARHERTKKHQAYLHNLKEKSETI